MSVTVGAPGQRRPGPAGSRGDARALAHSHRLSMRRRTRRIRRSIAALAVTLFTVAFATVYVQLASGHDPALVANADKRATAAKASQSSSASSGTSRTSTESSATSAGSGESSGTSEETSSGGEGTSASSAEESSGPSAVTTSQS